MNNKFSPSRYSLVANLLLWLTLSLTVYSCKDPVEVVPDTPCELIENAEELDDYLIQNPSIVAPDEFVIEFKSISYDANIGQLTVLVEDVLAQGSGFNSIRTGDTITLTAPCGIRGNYFALVESQLLEPHILKAILE